jgi:hypothetical protein
MHAAIPGSALIRFSRKESVIAATGKMKLAGKTAKRRYCILANAWHAVIEWLD